MDEYGTSCLLGIFCSSEWGILLAHVESFSHAPVRSKSPTFWRPSVSLIRKWRHDLSGIALCSELVWVIMWKCFVTFSCMRASSHWTVWVIRLVHIVIAVVLFFFSGGKIYFLLRRRWFDVRTTPVPPPPTVASWSPWETLGSCIVIQF